MQARPLRNGWRALPGRLAKLLPESSLQRLRQLAGPKRPRRGQRRIRSDLGVKGLFAALEERGVRYVVLRWFDKLPAVRPGGDIDLLIADNEYEAIADLFGKGGDGTVCDIYSVSGQPGTSHRGQPYLPPERAADVLARATRFNGFMVPGPEDHFFSLAYHSVYHKGLRSGLPTSQKGLVPDPHPQHDYAGELAALAQAAGIAVAIDMEGLDSCLASQGWRPTPEMARSLAKRNPWVRAVLLKTDDG